MTDEQDKSGGGIKVEIIQLANRLKRKLGLDPKDESEGFIDPDAVAAADDMIAKLCAECQQSIGGFLESLAEKWKQMREMTEDTAERQQLSEEVFTLAHEIKDIGSMCGYHLIAYFAESLRDYIGETELNMDAQRVIIQAHLDAMNLAHKQDIKEDEGVKATELKQLVKIAIQKYK